MRVKSAGSVRRRLSLRLDRRDKCFEGFFLKSSASDVPEIPCVRQIQRMRFGSKNQLSIRCNGQLSETVFVVHQVVEWKTGKRARGRQFSKERAMSAARGIVVSASPKVSAADPRFELPNQNPHSG